MEHLWLTGLDIYDLMEGYLYHLMEGHLYHLMGGAFISLNGWGIYDNGWGICHLMGRAFIT